VLPSVKVLSSALHVLPILRRCHLKYHPKVGHTPQSIGLTLSIIILRRGIRFSLNRYIIASYSALRTSDNDNTYSEIAPNPTRYCDFLVDQVALPWNFFRVSSI
jgi:hypothetical protein